MGSLGPIPVPAPLEPFLPYAKVVVALVGVAATVVALAMASPPAWVNIVISGVTALGVFTVPNSNIKAVLVDGQVLVSAGEAALAAARAGDAVDARSDVTVAMKAVTDATTRIEEIVTDVKDAGK